MRPAADSREAADISAASLVAAFRVLAAVFRLVAVAVTRVRVVAEAAAIIERLSAEV
jgi:hypothetical protein